MSEKGLNQKISACWEARLNRKIETAFSLHAEILAHTGLSFGTVNSDQMKKAMAQGYSFAEIMEVALLSVSLARAHSRFEEARTWIGELQDLHSTFSEVPAFRLYHEKGLNLIAVGDHFSALENFSKSVALSKNPIDEAYAKVNTLLCLESLGLPFEELASELKSKIPSSTEPVLEAVRSTFSAFEKRQCFRRGEFRPLFNDVISSSGPMTHDRYFIEWTKSIPILNSGFKHEIDLRAWTGSDTVLFQKSYLFRTLLGQIHPDDMNEIKPSDQIERLYLWVWRWLVEPKAFPFEKIVTLLSFWRRWMSEDFRLSIEDRRQLRNALCWISLFDPQSVEDLEDQLRSLQQLRSTYETPWLSFEYNCIQILQAKKTGNESLAHEYFHSMRMDPLWNEPTHHLSALISKTMGQSDGFTLTSELNALADRLGRLCSQNSTSHSVSGVDSTAPALSFDLTTHRILAAHGELTIHSEPLTAALELLCRESSVSFEKFSRVCFQIHRFDKLIHQPKVFNLVARLKSVLPEGCTIRSKNGILHTEGNWGVIVRKNADDATLQVAHAEVWDSIKTAKPTAHPLHHFIAGKIITRRDFEEITKRPTSTATRILRKLVKTGKLARSGNSRNIQYEVRKDFRL